MSPVAEAAIFPVKIRSTNPAINSVEEEDNNREDSGAKVEEAKEDEATLLSKRHHPKSAFGAPEKHPTETENQPWDPGLELPSDQDKT